MLNLKLVGLICRRGIIEPARTGWFADLTFISEELTLVEL